MNSYSYYDYFFGKTFLNLSTYSFATNSSTTDYRHNKATDIKWK
jgi:hypothetical protein